MTAMYPQPDFSTALSTMTHLNNEELKELLNNDTKFEEMLKDLKQFKDLDQEREMLLASISSLSEFNLTREPQLVEGREKLEELSQQGEELSKKVQEKLEEYRGRSGDMSTDTALALLQTAAAEMEEESESIAQKFLAGDVEIDDFVSQFAETRKIMHLRKVKAEKMSDLLVNQPRINNTVPNYINAPPVQINTNYFPSAMNNVPYPVGPMNMPLPGSYFPNY